MGHFKLALLLLASALLGATILWAFQGHSIAILPSAMSYSDFVAVLLTAISTLVAVIGLAFAIFALWGWSQFRRGVEAKIKEITPTFLAKEIKEGGTRQVLDELVIEFFRSELAKPGMAEAWGAEQKRQQDEFDELDDGPLEG